MIKALINCWQSWKWARKVELRRVSASAVGHKLEWNILTKARMICGAQYARHIIQRHKFGYAPASHHNSYHAIATTQHYHQHYPPKQLPCKNSHCPTTTHSGIDGNLIYGLPSYHFHFDFEKKRFEHVGGLVRGVRSYFYIPRNCGTSEAFENSP